MTGRDLLSACLRLIGVIASGESLSADEATDGLASLNRMLDGWSNEGLLFYAITQEPDIALTGGQATYTLGAGGNDTTRPQEIIHAIVRSNSLDYPVRILTLEEFVAIPNKSVQSNYPNSLYDDGGYPQRTITLYPVPSTGNALILWTKRALTEIATLDTVLSLPPGYERALVYCGAVELSPEYGKTPSDLVIQIAMSSKADIKRNNSRTPLLRVDSALTGRSHFNIFTGDYNR